MLATKVLLSQGRQGVGTFYYANGAYYSGELLAVLRTAVVCVKNSNGMDARSGKAMSRMVTDVIPLMMERYMMGMVLGFSTTWNDHVRDARHFVVEEIWSWSHGGLQYGTQMLRPLFLDKSKCCDGGKPELSKEENPVCGFRLSAAWL